MPFVCQEKSEHLKEMEVINGGTKRNQKREREKESRDRKERVKEKKLGEVRGPEGDSKSSGIKSKQKGERAKESERIGTAGGAK
jgi:hypothetical protein